MGRIVVAMYVSLDGVMETPSWTAPYWEETLSSYQDAAQRACTALLLGRITYEQFAAVWPHSPDEGAPFMNGIEKYVPTTTLEQAGWNARLLKGDAAGEIARLRQRQNLLVYGSGQLTRFLFQHGLVDEYRQMVFPVVLGQGMRLFEGQGAPYRFSQLESVRTPKNVLLNTYTK